MQGHVCLPTKDKRIKDIAAGSHCPHLTAEMRTVGKSAAVKQSRASVQSTFIGNGNFQWIVSDGVDGATRG